MKTRKKILWLLPVILILGSFILVLFTFGLVKTISFQKEAVQKYEAVTKKEISEIGIGDIGPVMFGDIDIAPDVNIIELGGITVRASSVLYDYLNAEKVRDGIVERHEVGEWVSIERNPKLEIYAPQEITINALNLYDRPHSSYNVNKIKIYFYKGEQQSPDEIPYIEIKDGLPNNGLPEELIFNYITWNKMGLWITGNDIRTGLSEIQAYNKPFREILDYEDINTVVKTGAFSGDAVRYLTLELGVEQDPVSAGSYDTDLAIIGSTMSPFKYVENYQQLRDFLRAYFALSGYIPELREQINIPIPGYICSIVVTLKNQGETHIDGANIYFNVSDERNSSRKVIEVLSREMPAPIANWSGAYIRLLKNLGQYKFYPETDLAPGEIVSFHGFLYIDTQEGINTIALQKDDGSLRMGVKMVAVPLTEDNMWKQDRNQQDNLYRITDKVIYAPDYTASLIEDIAYGTLTSAGYYKINFYVSNTAPIDSPPFNLIARHEIMFRPHDGSPEFVCYSKVFAIKDTGVPAEENVVTIDGNKFMNEPGYIVIRSGDTIGTWAYSLGHFPSLSELDLRGYNNYDGRYSFRYTINPEISRNEPIYYYNCSDPPFFYLEQTRRQYYETRGRQYYEVNYNNNTSVEINLTAKYGIVRMEGH